MIKYDLLLLVFAERIINKSKKRKYNKKKAHKGERSGSLLQDREKIEKERR